MPVACHFNDWSSSLSADIVVVAPGSGPVFFFANKTEENDMVDKTIPYLFYMYVYNVCIYIYTYFVYAYMCIYTHVYS